MSTVYLNNETNLGALSSLNTNTLFIGEGSQTVTNGLDQSGLADGIGSIFVSDRASVSFRGSAGEYLKAGISGVFLSKANGGRVYYTPLGSGTVTTCARIKWLGLAELYLGGGGTAVNLEVASGTAYVTETTNVTNMYIDGGGVTQEYKSTANTTVWLGNGGTLLSGRGWSGTMIMGGGSQASFEVLQTSGTLPTGGTLTIGSGRFRWRGGNITTINAIGDAILDFSDAPSDLTITNLNATAGVLKRSRLKSRFATVTVTNLAVRCAERDEIIA